jgi:hypothetical protein
MTEVATSALPVWTFRPNWTDRVLERLEWLTDVLDSKLSGAEQRRSLRIAPRRSFEFSTLLAAGDKTFFDQSIMRLGGGEWLLPVWHDGQPLTSPLTNGDVALICDTSTLDAQAGAFLLVLGQNGLDFEKVEVAADIGGGAISFPSAYTGRTFPAAMVYPLKRAWLTEQPKVSRITSRVGTAAVRFMLSRGADWAGTATLDSYLGRGVLSTRPNEKDTLDFAYDRTLAELDNATGRRLATDPFDRGFLSQQLQWQAKGREGHGALRDLLYTLNGRRNSLWVPSFNDDFILAEAALSGATSIKVLNGGMSFLGINPPDERSHLRIEMWDGRVFYRKVDTAVFGAFGEFLTFTSALPYALDPATVRQISFMDVCRLDQDAVEISHVTDESGVSEVSCVFRSFPDIRVEDVNNFVAIPTAYECIPPDPFFAGVVLLMGFDGQVEGSQVFIDESSFANTVADNFNHISTTTLMDSRFGGGSLLVPSTSFIEATTNGAAGGAFDFGSGPFTMECWAKSPSWAAAGAANQGILSLGDFTSGTNRVAIYVPTSGHLGVSLVPEDGSGSGGPWATFIGAATPADVDWHHIAVDRDGSGVVRLYLNGVKIAGGSFPDVLHNIVSARMQIGVWRPLTLFSHPFAGGHIDEVRVTKGHAYYATDAGFTPPTAKFPRS